ncbi:MAG TPA: hypothetical protein VFN84_05215 [Pseudolabrys sp.]|nr:hypothetical protein [Pseudolabrys sp.]
MNDPVTEDYSGTDRSELSPVVPVEALKKMRLADQSDETARQIREGADLAVKLADRLQRDEVGTHA